MRFILGITAALLATITVALGVTSGSQGAVPSPSLDEGQLAAALLTVDDLPAGFKLVDTDTSISNPYLPGCQASRKVPKPVQSALADFERPNGMTDYEPGIDLYASPAVAAKAMTTMRAALRTCHHTKAGRATMTLGVGKAPAYGGAAFSMTISIREKVSGMTVAFRGTAYYAQIGDAVIGVSWSGMKIGSAKVKAPAARPAELEKLKQLEAAQVAKWQAALAGTTSPSPSPSPSSSPAP